MTFSVSTSSVKKGESLLDTVQTIDAMGVDAIVVRHGAAGAPHRVASWSSARVVNAGDGCHEHPTQALLDAFTLRRHRGPSLDGCRVAIVGDIRALARRAQRREGVPRARLRAHARRSADADARAARRLAGRGRRATSTTCSPDVDVVYLLRIQRERIGQALFPSLREYARALGSHRRARGAAEARHARDASRAR